MKTACVFLLGTLLLPLTLGLYVPTINQNENRPLETEGNCTEDCDIPNYEKPMSNLKVGLILMVIGIVLTMLISLLCSNVNKYKFSLPYVLVASVTQPVEEENVSANQQGLSKTFNTTSIKQEAL